MSATAEATAYRELDPFDLEYDSLPSAETGLVASAKLAVSRGFHIFPLTPKGKVTLPGSHGFKDSKPPSDPNVLEPWKQNPDFNIGINLGASDLCVLDFDNGEKDIPVWLNQTRTLKVKTARGLHIYFRGARSTTGLFVNEIKVGDIKSTGGYVLGAGSIHPDGPVYTVIDDSPIAPLPDISGLAKQGNERVNASADGPPIPYGLHDRELFRIGCLLRNAGMNYQEIRDALINICVRRCENYGSDYVDMCDKKAKSACKYPVGQASPVLVFDTATDQTPAATAATDWRTKLKSIGELEQGDVRMLIDNFLPEGTVFIGGLPGECKTLFALSIARALTTGKPFLSAFGVKQVVPVIYLIPESGGRAFRKRCEAFQIPDDTELFLCRTVSEGSTLPLDDSSLLEAIRRLKPVVILDTIIRFSEADDENAATQNKKLVDDVIRLRQVGAVAVIGLHHATKAMRKDGMSLETALRGTGDIAASADAVYGLLRDSLLYNNGTGPNELDVKCLKPRDFDPPLPFRIAATVQPASRAEGAFVIRMESVIDRNHDFVLVGRGDQIRDIEARIEKMIADAPTITIKGLSEQTGKSEWEVRKAVQKLGYHRSRGGIKGGSAGWTKADPSTIEVSKPARIRADVDFAVAA